MLEDIGVTKKSAEEMSDYDVEGGEFDYDDPLENLGFVEAYTKTIQGLEVIPIRMDINLAKEIYF